MLFNRLNTNTYAHQRADSVCYVHKKFGVIKETKLKMQDGVTNQPKRFKIEALKSMTSDTNGPGKKAILVGTKTETKIKNKPLDMPDLSSPALTSRKTKVKRIKPLKGPSRPVLNDISEKPLQPMVEPCFKRIEPLKRPFRPAPLPLQQQHLRGPPMLGKCLNDVSVIPPKPLQPMVEPCFKRIEPLKGPFMPVPQPLLQPPKGPFRPVPQPLLQPLKGPFRPVPLPLQQPLKEPLRQVALALHQQEISMLKKQLEDIKIIYDRNIKLICCQSEPNMTIRHLTNTTLRSANKENLIKKPKEKYVESNSKEANAKKTLNKRKYNKKTTPRLSPGVLKAKIESLSPTVVKKQKKLQQAVLVSNSGPAKAKKPPNKRKYNKRTIETPSQQNLEQAAQAPKNNAENNMYVVKKVNLQQCVVTSNKLN